MAFRPPPFRCNLSRYDAASNSALDLKLAYAIAGTIQQKFPQYKFRQLLPVDTSTPPGARTLVWYYLTFVGLAKIIANYADDLDRADAQLEENVSRLRPIGIAYGYNDEELDEAALSGVPLPQAKSDAARRAHEGRHDIIAATGDSKYTLLGLLNQPNALTATPVNSAHLSVTAWSDKTGEEMVTDLDMLYRKIPVATNDQELPNTLAIPPIQYGLAVDTLWGVGISQDTVIERFQRTHPGVQVIAWNRLVGAGSGNVDRAVAYNRDPGYVKYIEVPFFAKSPQERNLETIVPTKSKSGGVVSFFPLSICYMDGI